MGDEMGDELVENRAPHAAYLEGLVHGELRYQRCGDCGVAVFGPRVLCDRCGGTALYLEVSAGLGTVYSSTAVTQRDAASYAVSLVDLDEGFRMMASVVDIDAEDVQIGMRVAARFEPVDDDALGQTVRVVFSPSTS
jgi:hypothetical protein